MNNSKIYIRPFKAEREHFFRKKFVKWNKNSRLLWDENECSDQIHDKTTKTCLFNF